MTKEEKLSHAEPAIGQHWRTFQILGILVGAASLVSLTQKAFEIGLAPILGDFVSYYRAISDFVFATLPGLWGWEVPQWLSDIWAISFVGTATIRRAQEKYYRNAVRVVPETFWDKFQNTVATLISGIFLIGLLPLIAAVLAIALPSGRAFFSGIKATPSDIWKEVMTMLTLAALFFCVNAFAPSA